MPTGRKRAKYLLNQKRGHLSLASPKIQKASADSKLYHKLRSMNGFTIFSSQKILSSPTIFRISKSSQFLIFGVCSHLHSRWELMTPRVHAEILPFSSLNIVKMFVAIFLSEYESEPHLIHIGLTKRCLTLYSRDAIRNHRVRKPQDKIWSLPEKITKFNRPCMPWVCKRYVHIKISQ